MQDPEFLACKLEAMARLTAIGLAAQTSYGQAKYIRTGMLIYPYSGDTYVLFYTSKAANCINGWECFSQWYRAPFRLHGMEFQTVEQYIMYKKAELFEDQAIQTEIMQTADPYKAKCLGRLVQNYDEAIWQKVRHTIALWGNYAKFATHENLKTILLATSNSIIAEASPKDTIWGIGCNKNHADAKSYKTWRGSNLLGFVLMEVRDMLSTTLCSM